MHRSRLGNIVIDCQTEDLLGEAGFWSAALGYPMPGDADPASRFVQLVTPPGEAQVIVQRVSHAPRVHLDIETDSIAQEMSRMEALGATLVTRHDDWVVMQAPGGQRFCIGKPYRDGFAGAANRWD